MIIENCIILLVIIICHIKWKKYLDMVEIIILWIIKLIIIMLIINFNRKRIVEIESSNLNIALISHGLPDQTAEENSKMFGFNFIKYIKETIGNISMESFLDYCSGRGVELRSIVDGPNELFEASSYDENKNEVFYLSYDLT